MLAHSFSSEKEKLRLLLPGASEFYSLFKSERVFRRPGFEGLSENFFRNSNIFFQGLAPFVYFSNIFLSKKLIFNNEFLEYLQRLGITFS